MEVNDLYQALPAAEPIHKDHYVRLLVEKLSEQGKNYYWTWAYNHIGYDRYHEGVAILSKTPIEAREILVQMWMIQQTIILAVSPWPKL